MIRLLDLMHKTILESSFYDQYITYYDSNGAPRTIQIGSIVKYGSEHPAYPIYLKMRDQLSASSQEPSTSTPSLITPGSRRRSSRLSGADQDKEPRIPIQIHPTKKNPSFEELREASQDHRYTVMAKKPLGDMLDPNGLIYRNKVKQDPSNFKPKGLWLGIGSSWVDWVEDNMPQWKGDNLYSIDIDEAKCLVIDDEEKFKQFEEQYGYKVSIPRVGGQPRRPPNDHIDWTRVSQDHSGIIIPTYFWRFSDRFWYSTWDVASGCIWDAGEAVQSAQQVPIK